jgi:hypothetical protein
MRRARHGDGHGNAMATSTATGMAKTIGHKTVSERERTRSRGYGEKRIQRVAL